MEYTVSEQNKWSTVKKNAVFRVIPELTENQIPEQFSAHFGVCCVVTRSILKPTDAITKEYRQELYELLILCQILHIPGSVKGPLSYKHNLLDMRLFH